MNKVLKLSTMILGALVFGGVLGWAFNQIGVEPTVAATMSVTIAIGIKKMIEKKYKKEA